jgi:hypothetical protein
LSSTAELALDSPRIDLYRKRWRRARASLRLNHVDDPGFARGDLGGRVTDLRMRLLVLPSDPDQNRIAFDRQFGEWWRREAPGRNRGAPFGLEVRPTAWATVWYAAANTGWDAYLALRRSGALDVGVGRPVASLWNQTEVFRLIPIVGRCLIALQTYASIAEHQSISGPFECSVALCGTQGSYLGHFASGWRDIGDPLLSARASQESGYVAQWEYASLAHEDAEAAVLAIGGWVEDCWGSSERRFWPPNSTSLDAFDWQRFR